MSINIQNLDIKVTMQKKNLKTVSVYAENTDLISKIINRPKYLVSVQLLNGTAQNERVTKIGHLQNGTLLNSNIIKQYNFTTTASQNSTSSITKLSQNGTVTKQYNC
jgi:hypothetical protein